MTFRENYKINNISSGLKNANSDGVVKLTLSNFRNYENLRLVFDSRPVVLTGLNGAGKTNILEALSLLCRGSGLRGSKLSDIGFKRPEDLNGKSWAVAAMLKNGDSSFNLGTSFDSSGVEKRKASIDGKMVRSPNLFSDLIGILWLTPQMDSLFIDSPSERRRFVDRMVTFIDPDHSGRCAAYDQALRQRFRLFRDGINDAKWHETLEDVLCRYGVSITAARCDFLIKMNKSLMQYLGPFPVPVLSMAGDIEKLLLNGPAIDAEEAFRKNLEQKRKIYIKNGESTVVEGPNRSDLTVIMRNNGRLAEECSTGEQKALLVSITLAHLALFPTKKSRVRVLLLDEVVAHLDRDRRKFLFERVFDTNSQAWITGTDEDVFSKLKDMVQRFNVKNGVVS